MRAESGRRLPAHEDPSSENAATLSLGQRDPSIGQWGWDLKRTTSNSEGTGRASTQFDDPVAPAVHMQDSSYRARTTGLPTAPELYLVTSVRSEINRLRERNSMLGRFVFSVSVPARTPRALVKR